MIFSVSEIGIGAPAGGVVGGVVGVGGVAGVGGVGDGDGDGLGDGDGVGQTWLLTIYVRGESDAKSAK